MCSLWQVPPSLAVPHGVSQTTQLLFMLSCVSLNTPPLRALLFIALNSMQLPHSNNRQHLFILSHRGELAAWLSRDAIADSLTSKLLSRLQSPSSPCRDNMLGHLWVGAAWLYFIVTFHIQNKNWAWKRLGGSVCCTVPFPPTQFFALLGPIFVHKNEVRKEMENSKQLKHRVLLVLDPFSMTRWPEKEKSMWVFYVILLFLHLHFVQSLIIEIICSSNSKLPEFLLLTRWTMKGHEEQDVCSYSKSEWMEECTLLSLPHKGQ